MNKNNRARVPRTEARGNGSKKGETEMKQSCQALFVLTFVYVGVFSLSSLVPLPWVGVLLEVAAVGAALLVSRRTLLCKAAPEDVGIGFSLRPILPSLPLLPLFLALVIGLSLGCEALGSLVGYDGAYDYGDSFWLCLLTSALLPAVTEELFCRYVFLRRLTPYSPMGAVLASALFFAFLHGNLVQIPYAFVAGVLLGGLAVASGSVLPGMLFHLANNALSISLHFFGDGVFGVLLPYLLALACLVGLTLLLVFRRRYAVGLRRLLERRELTSAQTVGQVLASPCLIFLLIFAVQAVLRGV